jgi:fused signal recognition particle receptor
MFGLLGKIFGRRDLAFDREAALAEIEELLVTADAGADTVADVMKRLRRSAPSSMEDLRTRLKEILLSFAAASDAVTPLTREGGLTIVLFVGVNGTGKTTSLAKVANFLKARGKRVLVAAADTFRAGAIEQAAVWCERLGLPLVRKEQGSDGSAVVFDAVREAVAGGFDVLLVDTAGRMHTDDGLMREMQKLDRTAAKAGPGAVILRYIVVDGQTGQNAFFQVREFAALFPLTGIILTKTDSGFKAGIVLRIVREAGCPVAFVCDGEGPGDIRRFDFQAYCDSVISE